MVTLYRISYEWMYYIVHTTIVNEQLYVKDSYIYIYIYMSLYIYIYIYI
jgi:hypothetical protein